MRKIIIGSLFTFTCVLHAEFKIHVEEKSQAYTILEKDQPVLTYHYGIVPVPEGVTGKYAVQRSNYIHPLYGPNGEVLTADYQKDHPHHRGIYWAWPEVSYKGELRDLHALQGVFARPVRMVRQEAGPEHALLEMEHVWKWGDTEEIVRERATLSVAPAQNGLRVIDFQFHLEGLKPGVTIARRVQKMYGGLNVRLSGRSEQTITKHIGNLPRFPQEAWAELVGVPPEGKEPIGVFLLQKPTNPIYPCDWQDFSNLNWLQPTFPARGMAYPLTPGRPLELSYRLIIRSGEGLKQDPAKLFASYTQDSPDPLPALRNYKLGENRSVLASFEETLKMSGPSQRQLFEQRLLNVLGEGCSSDFKRWACKQLQLTGSDACIPVVSPYLDQEAWMEAADLLLSLPGPNGPQALVNRLPRLEGERRATLIHALGLRQEPSVIPVLAAAAQEQDQQTSSAALMALSKLQGTAAAEALLGLKPTDRTAQRIVEAKLANAAIQRVGHPQQAHALFSSVDQDPAAQPQYRGAALIGLTALNPKEMATRVEQALMDKDASLRRAAAAALRLLDPPDFPDVRPSFPTLPKDIQLLLLPLWAERNMRSTEPEVLRCLASADEDLRWAAVIALRSLGSEAAVPKLLDLATGEKILAKEIESTLQLMKGEAVITTLRRLSQEEQTTQSLLALKILAARMDPGCIPFLVGVASGAEVKKSEIALTTIKNQGTADMLPRLKTLLLEKPELQESIAQAVIAICKRQPQARELLAAFLDTPIKAEIEKQLTTR